MFLLKLKNNNRGASTVNWGILIIITILVLGIILDLVNLMVAKNIVVDRMTYLCNTATLQGGLGPSAPYGWGDLYSSEYVTSSMAQAYFIGALESYSFIEGGSVSLSGTGYVGYKAEGALRGSAVYTPMFTRKFGAPSVGLSHPAKFIGFWVYRSEHV